MTGTVLVLPTSGSDAAVLRAEFLGRSLGSLAIEPLPGPSGALTARICGAISAAAPAGPLHVVAFGSSALLLPAVALAQRAGRRLVAEYVLVDPEIPQVTDAWPDAPVTVYTTQGAAPAAAHARLRGWSVHPMSALPEWVPVG